LISFASSGADSILILDLVVPAFVHFGPACLLPANPDGSAYLLKLLLGGVLELCILPFAFVEEFSRLRFLSVLAVGNIALVAAAVVAHAASCLSNGAPWLLAATNANASSAAYAGDGSDDDAFEEDPRDALWASLLWPANALTVVKAIPVFVCTFIFHFNVLPVHAELQRPTRGRLHCMVTTRTTKTTKSIITARSGGCRGGYHA
jgi:amino acid permease